LAHRRILILTQTLNLSRTKDQKKDRSPGLGRRKGSLRRINQLRLKRLLLQRNEVGYALGKDHQLLFFVGGQLGVGHHHHVNQDIIELPHLSLLNHNNNDLRESHCLTDLSCLILQSLHIQRSALTDRVLGLRPHQHVGLLEQILHSQLFPYHQIFLITRGTRTNGRRLFGGILLQDIRSL